MRIVIDTNVIASAIFFGGQPGNLLLKLMQHEFDAYVSKEILDEYQETINYLQNRYPANRIRLSLTQIAAACRMIEPSTHVQVCRDPDDNKFIDCAIDSHSLYIVSGDKDLLSMQQYQHVEMMTVGEFLRRFSSMYKLS